MPARRRGRCHEGTPAPAETHLHVELALRGSRARGFGRGPRLGVAKRGLHVVLEPRRIFRPVELDPEEGIIALRRAKREGAFRGGLRARAPGRLVARGELVAAGRRRIGGKRVLVDREAEGRGAEDSASGARSHDGALGVGDELEGGGRAAREQRAGEPRRRKRSQEMPCHAGGSKEESEKDKALRSGPESCGKDGRLRFSRSVRASRG